LPAASRRWTLAPTESGAPWGLGLAREGTPGGGRGREIGKRVAVSVGGGKLAGDVGDPLFERHHRHQRGALDRLAPVVIFYQLEQKVAMHIERGIPSDIEQQIVAKFNLQHVLLEAVDMQGDLEGIGQKRDGIEDKHALPDIQIPTHERLSMIAMTR
jgi:hypothetical protein